MAHGDSRRAAARPTEIAPPSSRRLSPWYRTVIVWWRVVGEDSHPVTGALQFSVSRGGSSDGSGERTEHPQSPSKYRRPVGGTQSLLRPGRYVALATSSRYRAAALRRVRRGFNLGAPARCCGVRCWSPQSPGCQRGRAGQSCRASACRRRCAIGGRSALGTRSAHRGTLVLLASAGALLHGTSPGRVASGAGGMVASGCHGHRRRPLTHADLGRPRRNGALRSDLLVHTGAMSLWVGGLVCSGLSLRHNPVPRTPRDVQFSNLAGKRHRPRALTGVVLATPAFVTAHCCRPGYGLAWPSRRSP